MKIKDQRDLTFQDVNTHAEVLILMFMIDVFVYIMSFPLLKASRLFVVL